MITEEIIKNLDEGGLRSYYSFETFVLHLLKHHLSTQEKRFLTKVEPNYPGDAIAPDGFDEFKGPTLIEVKFSLAKIPGKMLFDRILRQLSMLPKDVAIENLLIVYAQKIPQSTKDRHLAYVESIQLPVKVFLWGPEELNRVANKHRKIVNNIANNLFSLRLETAIAKPEKDWKSERSEHLESLRSCYKKGQFSLFLGAGVSSSAGMPDWNTLLNSLFVTYLTQEFDQDSAIADKDINELVNRLNSIDEPSALMAARYLRKGLTRNNAEAKEFTTAITKNLYKLRDSKKPINSLLIAAVAGMCMPRRTGAKVRSVVTYNFDDLLERELSRHSILYRCIYTDSESYDPDELPVYHVHGFLPEDRKGYEGLDSSTLVFSEEGYHQIYSDPYHWSNLVQLNSLRENHCLMVGLSMTDPNLRRLLDISSRNIERSKHYAFMKRISKDKFCFDYGISGSDRKQVISNTDGAEQFLSRHHTLNEELMKELGVTVIWYESYDEIPLILNDITKQ